MTFIYHATPLAAWQERPIDECYLCATPLALTFMIHVLHAEYITCVLSIIATVILLFPMERTNYINNSKLHWAGSTPAQPTHLWIPPSNICTPQDYDDR